MFRYSFHLYPWTLQIARKCLRSNGYFFEKCRNESYDNLNMCMIIIIQLQLFWSVAILNIYYFCLWGFEIFWHEKAKFCLFEKYYFLFLSFFLVLTIVYVWYVCIYVVYAIGIIRNVIFGCIWVISYFVCIWGG